MTTAPANSYKTINGNFLEAKLLGVSGVSTAVMSMQESRTSCVYVLVVRHLTIFYLMMYHFHLE